MIVMATAYPIASTADGRVKWSDGSIRGNQSNAALGGYAANVAVPNTVVNKQNIQVPAAQLSTTSSSQGSGSGSKPSTWSGWGQTFANEEAYRAEQARQEQAQNEAYINSIYQPQEDYLNTVEQTYRNQLPGYQAEAQKNYDVNAQLLGTSYGTTKTDIANQESQGKRATEDALSKARRIFQEQQIGSQQRFGGSSSAGQAANELLARNLQTEQGQTQRQAMDFQQKIGQLYSQAKQKYDDSMLQLEQQKQTALTQIQREFDQKLLEIANNRTQLASAKAQMRLQALMDLRNKTFAIQQQTQQFQQALALQNQNAQANISNYAQNAGGYVQGAQGAFGGLSGSLQNAGQPMAMNYNAGAQSADQNQYLGYAQQLSPKKDENNYNMRGSALG